MVNELSRPALFLNLPAGDPRYHGDFDWPGLAIGNWIMRACGGRPRRFGVADYLAALRDGPVRGRALGPESVDADWDKHLGPAMREHGRAVDEETIAATLMRDLEWTGQ